MDNAARLAIFQADHAGDTATLRRYATADDPATRLSVARAEHTPPASLRAILGRPARAARSPEAPQRNYEAMTELASNPGMPLDLLTKLLDVAPRNEGAEVARTRIADLAAAEPAAGLDL